MWPELDSPSPTDPEADQKKQAGCLYICATCDHECVCEWRKQVLKWAAGHFEKLAAEEVKAQNDESVFFHHVYCTYYRQPPSSEPRVQEWGEEPPCECCSVRRWCRWCELRKVQSKAWVGKAGHPIIDVYDRYNCLVGVKVRHVALCKDRPGR